MNILTSSRDFLGRLFQRPVLLRPKSGQSFDETFLSMVATDVSSAIKALKTKVSPGLPSPFFDVVGCLEVVIKDKILYDDKKLMLVFIAVQQGAVREGSQATRLLHLLTADESRDVFFSLSRCDTIKFWNCLVGDLLDAGLPVDSQVKGDSLFMWASKMKCWPLLERLLDSGVQPSACKSTGGTVFHFLCEGTPEWDCFSNPFDIYLSWNLLPDVLEKTTVKNTSVSDILARLLPSVDIQAVNYSGETAFSRSKAFVRHEILSHVPSLVLEGRCRLGQMMVSLAFEAVAHRDYALLERLQAQTPDALSQPDENGRVPTWGCWEIHDPAAMSQMVDYLKAKGVWSDGVQHVSSEGQTFLSYGLSREAERCQDPKYKQLSVKLERLVTELPTRAWVEVAPNGHSASFWLHACENSVPGLVATYITPRRAAMLEASFEHCAARFEPAPERVRF